MTRARETYQLENEWPWWVFFAIGCALAGVFITAFWAASLIF